MLHTMQYRSPSVSLECTPVGWRTLCSALPYTAHTLNATLIGDVRKSERCAQCSGSQRQCTASQSGLVGSGNGPSLWQLCWGDSVGATLLGQLCCGIGKLSWCTSFPRLQRMTSRSRPEGLGMGLLAKQASPKGLIAFAVAEHEHTA